MRWWMDLVLLAALAVMTWALYRMHRESEAELQSSAESEAEPSGIPLGAWFRNVYPRKLIRQAGMLPDRVKLFYWVGKVTVALLLPLLVAELLQAMALFPFVLLVLVGFFAVDLWLLARRRARRRKIGQILGYFVDLIAALLKSGMPLTQAFEQAARYGLPPKNPLAREIDLLARELSAGGDRIEAFRALDARTGVDDITRLAALMEVGHRVGAPLGDTLENQAELLRARQWEQAEALVNRRALEALFPMMLVSLPIILVLVFFPAAVQIFEIFAQFRGALG